MTEVTTVKLKDLKPSPNNVREYESTEVDQLATSISNVGVLQSLLVTPNGKGYEVVAGGRRLAAMKSIKYKGDIPVQIIEADNLAEVSLSENLYRRQLEGHEIWAALLAMNDGKVPTVKQARAMAKRLSLTEAEVRKATTLAACHPDLLDQYKAGKLDESILKAVASLDQNAQYAIVTEAQNDPEVDSWYLTRKVQELVGFLSYSDENKLKKVGEAEYKKAGGTITKDLFSDSTIINDPALLARLYADYLAREDKALAAQVPDAVVLPEVSTLDWHQTWLQPDWATDEDRERYYEIVGVLNDKDEELPEENAQALREEMESLEANKCLHPDSDYYYGVHHGRWYRKPKLSEAEAAEQEEATETVTPLSQSAKQFFEEEKLALMQRCVAEDADDLIDESKRLLFVMARYVCGPQHTRGYTAYLQLDGELPSKDWMHQPDEKKAWYEFVRQQPDETAKDMAWMWSALFVSTLEDHFLSRQVLKSTAEHKWEMPDDFFKLYHRADQLDALAEDMGIEGKSLIEFKGMKLKDKRAQLEHKYQQIIKRGNYWLPEQLRNFREVSV